MKFKFTYLLFAIGVVAVALSYGSSQGRAAAANSGNTGAPEDASQTCVTCHGTSADIQVLMNLELLDDAGAPVTEEYVPGTMYTAKVTVDVSAGTPAAYGFQMVALKGALDEAGDEASEYGTTSPNAKISTTSLRTYVEQAGPSATPEFTVEWTAPEMGSGPVSFYVCGNGINGDSNTSGDGAACMKMQLNEMEVSSASTIDAIADLKVFPNPVADQLTLQVEAISSQSGLWTLNNLSGQTMSSDALNLTTGMNSITIPVNQLSTGVYFLKLQTEEGLVTRRIVKQ